MSIVYYPGYSQQIVTPNHRTHTILSVTQSNPCVITTADNSDYVAGMIVSFLIPDQFGMIELNNRTPQVLQVTSTTITVNLDSSTFTAFAYPSPVPSAYTPPSVIPYASGPYLPPLPLPNSNQTSFKGVIYNAGAP